MADPKFKCPRCGLGMNHKCVLKTHIYKKKQCEAYVEDLNRVELIDYFNTLAQNTKETPFQCEGCKKFYSCKRSLSKHMESICKKEKCVTISASVLNELLEKGLNKILEELKQQFVPQTINTTNISNTNIILNCFYSPNMEHVEPLLSCDTKNWFDAIIDEDDEIVDPIMKDIKLSLSNNKSTLKQKIKF